MPLLVSSASKLRSCVRRSGTLWKCPRLGYLSQGPLGVLGYLTNGEIKRDCRGGLENCVGICLRLPFQVRNPEEFTEVRGTSDRPGGCMRQSGFAWPGLGFRVQCLG